MRAFGPVPGDAAFVKLRAGRRDAAVAMHHDRSRIPVEPLGSEADPATGEWRDPSGVDTAPGLPAARTLVDRGTASDTAGTGAASGRSLVEATECAERLAARRRA